MLSGVVLQVNGKMAVAVDLVVVLALVAVHTSVAVEVPAVTLMNAAMPGMKIGSRKNFFGGVDDTF